MPPYGLTFGAAPHMCIGKRIVVGVKGEGGSHVDILRLLFEAGVRLDPDRQPVRMSSCLTKFSRSSSYSVHFAADRVLAQAKA
jgi:hypothetical protein